MGKVLDVINNTFTSFKKIKEEYPGLVGNEKEYPYIFIKNNDKYSLILENNDDILKKITFTKDSNGNLTLDKNRDFKQFFEELLKTSPTPSSQPKLP